ncbi:MAG: FAD-dependent oxidoreductase [Burkholderiales bacterium]|nr:FAD-dependent oxidoreductase [Burkholderiales bacterium]
MTVRSYEFDVIVAGCGIAGLSAAVSAQELGARVAILERAPIDERGGNTRYTEAYLRMKSESEVTDDFESHLADNAGGHLDPSMTAETTRPYAQWPSIVKALSFADPELISILANGAGPTIAWLKRFGIRFDFLPTHFLTQFQPLLMPVGGGLAMIEALAADAQRKGTSFFYETTALSLFQDESGIVTGLRAVNKANEPIRFNAKSVILASGGFEGNAEMQTRYIGPRAVFLRPSARGGYYNKGEGIQMALEIGAAPCGDFASYHPQPIDPRSGRSEPVVLIYPYGILVNLEGRRFTDEASGTIDLVHESVTRQIIRQTNGIAYVILDNKVNDIPNKHIAVRTDQPPITAASLPELAEKLKISAVSLLETVGSYNKACNDDGTFKPSVLDALATQGLTPPKSNWARPIDHPPYFAYPVISSIVFTFGGLKVNGRAQVLNKDGAAISGLYAAGETIGFYYRNYTGATSVLKGTVFGRIAGIDAAQRVLGGKAA